VNRVKIPKKEKTVLVAARACEDDVRKLQIAGVNLSALIRAALKDAAKKV